MATRFPLARAQATLATATGYRPWSRFTFSRQGVTRVLEPTGGSLTQDARRGGRWDGRLSFTGDDVIPRRPTDLLTPFGTRVTAELGIELLDGTISSVPCGTFEISSARTRIGADERKVDITLADRSRQIENYRFESPLTIATGSDLATMINRVVTNRTGFSPSVTATGQTLQAARVFGLDQGTGPWSEILDVLAGFSRTAWYNRTGRIQIGSVTPDPLTAYPLDALTGLSADFDETPPNVIVVRGESQDGPPPVYAITMDSDPGSPTYAGAGPGGSPYGRVTEYFSSPLVTTVSQARSAAATILNNRIGAGATYTLSRPYDPTLDAGDVVSFDGGTFVLDAITVSLDGQTTAQAREIA